MQRTVKDPPIIFTGALALKSGNTRKFLFQEVESLLTIFPIVRSGSRYVLKLDDTSIVGF